MDSPGAIFLPATLQFCVPPKEDVSLFIWGINAPSLRFHSSLPSPILALDFWSWSLAVSLTGPRTLQGKDHICFIHFCVSSLDTVAEAQIRGLNKHVFSA